MRAALAARDENLTNRKLFADVKLLNDLSISTNIFLREILKKASPLSDKLQEAETTVVVFFVAREVRRKHVNVGCEDCNLDLRASGVSVTFPVLFDDLRLLFLGNWHCDSLK